MNAVTRLNTLLLVVAALCGPGCGLGLPVVYGAGCPSTAPGAGTSCPISALSCEYGGDAFSRGTTTVSCVGGSGQPLTWHLTGSKTAPGPNASACPATWALAQAASSCSGCATAACEYDEGKCANVCGSGGTWTWECRARTDVSSTVGSARSGSCEEKRPLEGTRCAVDDQLCAYGRYCLGGELSFGPSMHCQGGTWHVVVQNFMCPSYTCPGAP